MATQKRKYEAAFKEEALRLLSIRGKSVRQIEEELGITAGLLNNGNSAINYTQRQGAVQLSEEWSLEAENRQLRRELERAKAERDLLKHLYQHRRREFYLALVLDVFSRKIVGWAMASQSHAG